MLGTQSLTLSPDIVSRLCAVQEFRGFWSALQAYTTGLQLLGDVAMFGKEFQKTCASLAERKIDETILLKLHAVYCNKGAVSDFRSAAPEADGSNIVMAAPEDIRPLTGKLLLWLETALEEGRLHPLAVIGIFAAVFLHIAPFEQGNEKLVWLLVTVLMLRQGYDYAPYTTLESIAASHAGEMDRVLGDNRASLDDGRPDWHPWLSFFLGLLIAQKDTLHDRLAGKKSDLGHLPTLSASIMALFRDHSRLQMNEIIKITGARRSTVKLRLAELTAQGYLRRHGQARSTWYSLQ